MSNNDDDQVECDPSTKPSYVQSCYKTSGCNPQWVASPWSAVSTDTNKAQTSLFYFSATKIVRVEEY